MKHEEIKKKFLDFFIERDHLLLASATLIPKEHDPTGLFTNSGMHPIKPFFLGVQKPPKKNLCSNQRCFRTVDIDKVGTNDHTLTFFFMLGSWSVGDYWKKKAIELAYDLLVNGFSIPKEKLWATVFRGNADIPRDEETIKAWKKVGLPSERIVELGEDDNLWFSGVTGPCGTCTEVYYDQGESLGCGKKECKPGCDCDRFVEIWNAGVFIEYNLKKDGSFEKLPIKSVDTGAGLERLSTVLQGKKSIYETDMLKPIVDEIEKLSKTSSRGSEKEMKIITDHIRAIVFLIADGVSPSKIERGYILRRLLRRMIRHGNKISFNKEDFLSLAKLVIKMYKNENPHIEKEKLILQTINDEYDKFMKTLEKEIPKFVKTISELRQEGADTISGDTAFYFYTTSGLPIEMQKEIAEENNMKVDEKTFDIKFEEHQKISLAGAEKRFKGGLADDSYETTKYHTAAHLLLQALIDVLGDHVEQRGSNITSERLRLDFSHDKKLTAEQIKKVEKIVNEKIREALPVKKEEMTLEEAKKKGARGVFEHKYGEKVFVYSVGDYSKEICGGPHVSNTRELGKFKILKEESSSSGIRRIKAKLE